MSKESFDIFYVNTFVKPVEHVLDVNDLRTDYVASTTWNHQQQKLDQKDAEIEKLKSDREKLVKCVEYYSNWDKLVRDDEGLNALDTILASKKATDTLANL